MTTPDDNQQKDTQEKYQCATFLMQVSNALSRHAFIQMVQSNDNRFGQLTLIFDRLRRDFMFQIRGILPKDIINQYRTASGRVEVPLVIALPVIAANLRAQAHHLCPQVKKKDLSFTVGRGQSFDQKLHQLLKQTTGAIQHINEYEKKHHCSTNLAFTVKNTLFALHCFVESIHTLRYPTHHVLFEHLLKSVFFDRPLEYTTTGYIHDLLAHDKVSITTNPNIVAIHMAPRYLSTRVEVKNSVNLPEASLKFERFPMVA
jgi:hypothetical protein